MIPPTVGRIVHFKLPSGQARPAVIVHVWNATCLNLRVFLDGSNDAAEGVAEWQTSVVEGPGARQWSWPPKV